MKSEDILMKLHRGLQALETSGDLPLFGSNVEPQQNRMSITFVETQETFVIQVKSEDFDSLEGLAKIAVERHPNSIIYAIKELRGLAQENLDTPYLSLKDAKDLVEAARRKKG